MGLEVQVGGVGEGHSLLAQITDHIIGWVHVVKIVRDFPLIPMQIPHLLAHVHLHVDLLDTINELLLSIQVFIC